MTAALARYLNARNTGRAPCTTRRIKVGQLAAVYVHTETDAEGNVTGRSISVPGRYHDKDIGRLLDAIADEINGAGR